MEPHRKFTTRIGMLQLEAPEIEGFAFLGPSGWLGVRCSCGWLVSARSMPALELGLQAHQHVDVCPDWAAFKASEAEEPSL